MKNTHTHNKKTIFPLLLLIASFFLASQTLNAQAWLQNGLDIDGEATINLSGFSVSLSADGNIMAIGAPLNDNANGSGSGHVRVYQFDGTNWNQLGADIDGETVGGDFSGESISLSTDGNTLAIGAEGNDGNGTNSGHVRVYRFDGTTWNQLGADIDGEASGDESGSSVSMSSDGNTLAIGAKGNDGNGTDSGHVRVYRFDGTTWNQLGADIDGEVSGDKSGRSVSMSSDGNTLAIGAEGNDGNGTDSGHVRVYRFDGTTWNQLGADIDGEAADDLFGWSVSLSTDGNTLAIGAPQNDGNGTLSGHVRVFRFDGTTWNQLGADIDGEVSGDKSGTSVSLSNDGNILAIGANRNDGNGASSGHVRVYRFDGTTWNQLGIDIDGEVAGDLSGTSVSLNADGTIVAIGAPDNDGNGNLSGHARVYRYVDFPPTVTIDGPAGPVNGSFDITITFSEPVTGFVQSGITITNGTITAFSGSGASYTATIDPTTDGEVTVQVPAGVAIDAASNDNLASNTYSVTNDGTAPSVTIDGPAGPVNGSFDITITFSEGVTGFVQSDITITNGTITAFSGSGASYTATIDPTTDGEVTVQVPAGVAIDAASNDNLASNTYSVTNDGTAP
ncbi:Ig-like domain-containing protein, partial [Leptobacterium sp. I13]|uniref:Ig-like domain-containing protein n=1 Tax=Leptobacterium meishanense TaxID=3128904 RepID=UPI0030EDCD97